MTKILELPAAELKHALAGLSKVISHKSTLPVLGHLRVEPDGNDAVWLHGTDLDTFVTCRIPLRNTEDFPACIIPFEQLNKLVKTSKADIALVRENDGKFNVRYPLAGSVVKTPMPTIDLAEWPTAPALKSSPSIMEDGFKTAFKQAMECSSTDDSRYVLKGACLDVDQKDCHTVVATDGRHLYAANTFTFPLKQSVIVPDRKFLNWAGFMEDGPWHLAVELDKNSNPAWIAFQSNRWRFITKAIDGSYPNWRQVVPAEAGKSKVAFSPESVSAILGALPGLPSDHDLNLPVKLEAMKSLFTLGGRAKGSEEWTKIAVPGVQVTGPGLNVTLNRTLLSKALRFGLTELDFYSRNEPVRFSAPGRKLVIMPIGPGNPPTTPPVAGAAPASAPSAAEPEHQTEQRTTMPAKSANAPESSLSEAVQQIEKIKETLKAVLIECSTVLAAIKSAEKEKKATDKEVESVRTALRSVQKVQI
jgi:DNA polymerase III sliding clamp (beta) subunit (PCNA family)